MSVKLLFEAMGKALHDEPRTSINFHSLISLAESEDGLGDDGKQLVKDIKEYWNFRFMEGQKLRKGIYNFNFNNGIGDGNG